MDVELLYEITDPRETWQGDFLDVAFEDLHGEQGDDSTALDIARRQLQGTTVRLLPERWMTIGGLQWAPFPDDMDTSGSNWISMFQWGTPVLAIVLFEVAGVRSVGVVTPPQADPPGHNYGIWLDQPVKKSASEDSWGPTYVYPEVTLRGSSCLAPFLDQEASDPLPPPLATLTPAYCLVRHAIQMFLSNLGDVLIEYGTRALTPEVVVDCFDRYWSAVMTFEDLP